MKTVIVLALVVVGVASQAPQYLDVNAPEVLDLANHLTRQYQDRVAAPATLRLNRVQEGYVIGLGSRVEQYMIKAMLTTIQHESHTFCMQFDALRENGVVTLYKWKMC